MSKNPSQVIRAISGIEAWTPVAPHVPKDYQDQRYFSRTNRPSPAEYTGGLGSRSGYSQAGVFRFADKNHVELSAVFCAGPFDAKTTIALSSAELRELATRLLDAAHDLDAFPASMLMVPEA